MNHTEGKLVDGVLNITINNVQKLYYCIGQNKTKNVVAITGEAGDGGDELSAADARRLVACWNACEAFETESLEAEKGSLEWITNVALRNRELRYERDGLVKALDILERLSGLAMMEDDPVRVAARAILARHPDKKS